MSVSIFGHTLELIAAGEQARAGAIDALDNEFFTLEAMRQQQEAIWLRAHRNMEEIVARQNQLMREAQTLRRGGHTS